VSHDFDVLVVGAGGAGLYAALEAGKKARTAVFSKVYAIRSHTGAAQGGISAALGNVEEDRPEWHAYDTIKGGDYLVDQQAALLMADEAVQAIYDLENRGLPFNRTAEGRIDQRRFGGHTRNFGEAAVCRACYAADRTGHMILQTLYQQCIKNEVNFFDEFQVVDVILEGNRCAGLVAVALASGQLRIFRAKAVVFATGGFGRIYKISSNAYANTGDGPAILARRGVPLEDMEFFQFHPTGIKDMGILISEAVRGEGGVLRNNSGERFMARYAPGLLDLAPRDMVSRAIMTEIKNGAGIRGDKKINDYVYLDATGIGRETLENKLPEISGFARTYLGIDPAEQPIPVQPTAHYAMGGIPTDVDGRVRKDGQGNFYEGLYAAGECACVSIHGANRLGTNSLLDLVVFGRRAGVKVAQYVKDADLPEIKKDAAEFAGKRMETLTDGQKGPNRADISESMQAAMMARVGVYRSAREMAEAVAKLAELREQAGDLRVQDKSKAFNTELLEVLELQNMLDLAYITAVSANNREESRGAHAREDFPNRNDDKWLKHTLVHLDAERVRIDYMDVDTSKWPPKPRVY